MDFFSHRLTRMKEGCLFGSKTGNSIENTIALLLHPQTSKLRKIDRTFSYY
ncbi:MAG: hypothetical protein ACRC62_28295 [Microcoleus sp.]